jgi:hypothetical protein
MSTEKKKLAPDEAWDALGKMAVDDEVERVLALSDEDLDAELRKTGANPERVRQRGEELGRRLVGERAGSTNRAPPSRRRWAAWLAAATLGAVVAGVLAMNAGTVVAWFRPLPIGPDDGGLVPGPSREQERAASLRVRAQSECSRVALEACRRDLDEASALDPAGEARPDVVELRRILGGREEEGGLKPRPR